MRMDERKEAVDRGGELPEEHERNGDDAHDAEDAEARRLEFK